MKSIFYIQSLKKYATFKGRASRTEFWTFTLVNNFIYFGLLYYEATYRGLTLVEYFESETPLIAEWLWLIVIVPTFAISYRRVHDVNHKGWHSLVPFYNLYLFLQKGTIGRNLYGEDTKLK